MFVTVKRCIVMSSLVIMLGLMVNIATAQEQQELSEAYQIALQRAREANARCENDVAVDKSKLNTLQRKYDEAMKELAELKKNGK